MQDYISVLVGALTVSRRSSVAAIVSAPDMYLGIDQATPCGLILNELVSNALTTPSQKIGRPILSHRSR